MNENGNSFKQFLTTKKGRICLILVLYIVILGIFTLLSQILLNTHLTYIPMIFAIVMGVFGWKALSRIQPNIFLILPIGGWIIYFLVKGVLSVMIGVFVAPYVIAKWIIEKVVESK